MGAGHYVETEAQHTARMERWRADRLATVAAEAAEREPEQPMYATGATLEKLFNLLGTQIDRVAALEQTCQVQAAAIEELQRVCNAQADELEQVEARVEAAELQATGAVRTARAALHGMVAGAEDDEGEAGEQSDLEASAAGEDGGEDDDGDDEQTEDDQGGAQSINAAGGTAMIVVPDTTAPARLRGIDDDARTLAATAFDQTYLRAVHAGMTVDEANAAANKAHDDALFEAAGAEETPHQ